MIKIAQNQRRSVRTDRTEDNRGDDICRECIWLQFGDVRSHVGCVGEIRCSMISHNEVQKKPETAYCRQDAKDAQQDRQCLSTNGAEEYCGKVITRFNRCSGLEIKQIAVFSYIREGF